MPYSEPLDVIPLWGVFLITVAAILLAIECGFRLGQHQGQRSELEDKPPVGEMVGATLALLAFMLAFTFGMAATRFEVRRGLVIDEANAIGTTYLRAGLLPEPYRGEVRRLLREYVSARLEAIRPGKLSESISRSEELQSQLWSQAAAVGEKNQGSIVVGLFIGSMNEVIDFHAKRLAIGVRNRIPSPIWAALYFMAVLGTAALGYHAGLADSGRSLAIVALVLAFSAVMTLIADLDRPQAEFLRVSQQTMIDLRRTMAPPGQ